MLMQSGSESESGEELEKQLLKSRISRANIRRQIESDENNISTVQYLDRIMGNIRRQLCNKSNQRITEDGGNKQELDSSTSRSNEDIDNEQGSDSRTGRNCPDDSDEQGPANSSNLAIAMDNDEETNLVMLSLSKAIGDATRQLQDKSNSTYCKDRRKKQKSDSSFALRDISTALRRDRNSMDDGRTVGDQSKENSRANEYTTNTNRRAMKVDESSGRQKGKVGTQGNDEDERKVASTVKQNKTNMKWNKKKKDDGGAAVRRPNMNEKNRINGRTMNIGKSGGRQKSKNESRERCGGKRKTASKVGPNKAKKQWNGKETGDGRTARRWSNMNKSNGKTSTEMNGRASNNGSGSRKENRKEKGHTEGGNNTKKKTRCGKRGKNTAMGRIEQRMDG